MKKKEFIIFWKRRIVILRNVLEDINMWNVKLFMRQILPLRITDTDKYWQMIDAWYEKLQKGETVSNNTKLI